MYAMLMPPRRRYAFAATSGATLRHGTYAAAEMPARFRYAILR